MVVAEKKKVSDIIPQKATFRPNGKQIAICGEKILKFYDLNSGKVQSFEFHFLLKFLLKYHRSTHRILSVIGPAGLHRSRNVKISRTRTVRVNSRSIKLENLRPELDMTHGHVT